MKLNIKDTFNKELPADPILENYPRQVVEACYSYVSPTAPKAPKMLHVSDEMLHSIGLNSADKNSEEFLNVFSGAKILDGTKPFSMCYGGHQFGHWAGQLGDGRAINLTEVNHNNKQWVLQLKGAGITPYSRTADGLAVLRSSIREHLCSEAMYHLGVPTTRSLALALTGDEVWRDMMYDGNAAYEKGAVVCRVAPSFIRFGNFQIFAARRDTTNLKKLTDYTIRHLYPHIEDGTKEGYIQFFKEVSERTLDMIIHWQRVGFVHGVMNTDNLSILGLTIDYGPYGWLEGYDENWTPNTTDVQSRRYRFGNQPNIGLWNLLQLANALYPLIEEAEPLQLILNQYNDDYRVKYMNMMSSKLGLSIIKESDIQIINDLEKMLHVTETDMTIFFRNLALFDNDTNLNEGIDFLVSVMDSFYRPEEIRDGIISQWREWFSRYQSRLNEEQTSNTERIALMNKTNPKYVLRNYMAQLAIDQANNGEYTMIDELYQLLKRPYEEQPENQKWFAKRPEWARHKVGCSMLSCSS